jgi:hypothetical protein
MDTSYLLVPVKGDETSLFISPDIEQIKKELKDKYDDYKEIHKYINGKWYMMMKLNIPTKKENGYEDRKQDVLISMDWF